MNREVFIQVPVRIRVPVEYDIHLKLAGPSSSLEIKARHEDGSDALLSRGFAFQREIMKNAGFPGTVEKMGDNTGVFSVEGDEETVLAPLIGELAVLRQYLSSLQNQPPASLRFPL